LTEQQWKSVERDLRRSPRDLGFTQTLWDGKLLSEHLRLHYDVEMGTRQCQRLFRQMDFRLRKPRPLIAKADPVAQTAFKKTASPRSRP
jgi:transposase